MNLKELLLESGPSRVLYHFTSIENLRKILRDGFLKGKPYNISSVSKKDCGDVPEEICLVRKSMSRNIDSVSIKNADVRFVLQIDKMRDSVRGTKIKPIAEFPKQHIKKIKTMLGMRMPEVKESRINYLAKELIRDSKSFIKKQGKLHNEIGYKLHQESGKHFADVTIDRLISLLKALKTDQKYREGEERIVAPKVPLNKKYMTIEIVDGSGIYHGRPEKFLASMEKWEHMFLKNNEYKIVVDHLEKKIK